MDITAFTSKQDALMGELNETINSFIEDNPEINVEQLQFEMNWNKPSESAFRSVMSSVIEGSRITRSTFPESE